MYYSISNLLPPLKGELNFLLADTTSSRMMYALLTAYENFSTYKL